MRVLTIQQPWLGAIITAGKNPENRTTNIAGGYRGIVALHAGKRADQAAYHDIRIMEAIADASYHDDPIEPWDARGAVVGLATLADVHFAQPGCCNGSVWADPGRWHLVWEDVRPLEPIPYVGALGLRVARPELVHAVGRQLAPGGDRGDPMSGDATIAGVTGKED